MAYTEADLTAALKAAHAAGDEGAARTLAGKILELRAASQPTATPIPTERQTIGPTTGNERLYPVGEPGSVARDVRGAVSQLPGINHLLALPQVLASHMDGRKPLSLEDAVQSQRAISEQTGAEAPLGAAAGNLAATAALPWSKAGGVGGAVQRATQAAGLGAAGAADKGANALEGGLEAAVTSLGLEGLLRGVAGLYNMAQRGAGARADRAALKVLRPTASDVAVLRDKYGSVEQAGRAVRELGAAEPGMDLRQRGELLDNLGEQAVAKMDEVITRAKEAGVKVDAPAVLDQLKGIREQMFGGQGAKLTATNLAARSKADDLIARFEHEFVKPEQTVLGVMLPGASGPSTYAAPSVESIPFTTNADELSQEPVNALYKLAQKSKAARQIDPMSPAGLALARKARLASEGGIPVHEVEGPAVGPGRVGNSEVWPGDVPPAETTRAPAGGMVVRGEPVPIDQWEKAKTSVANEGFFAGSKHLTAEAARKDPEAGFMRRASSVLRRADDAAIAQMDDPLAQEWRSAKRLAGAREDFAPMAHSAADRLFASTEAGLPDRGGSPRYTVFRTIYEHGMGKALPWYVKGNAALAGKQQLMTIDPRYLATIAALEGENP